MNVLTAEQIFEVKRIAYSVLPMFQDNVKWMDDDYFDEVFSGMATEDEFLVKNAAEEVYSILCFAHCVAYEYAYNNQEDVKTQNARFTDAWETLIDNSIALHDIYMMHGIDECTRKNLMLHLLKSWMQK